MRAVLCLLIVALGAPALAAEPSPTAVVFSPELGEDGARKAWLSQYGRDAGVRFVSTDEVFPDSSVVLLGDGNVHACAGDPLSAEQLAGLVQGIVEHTTMMEYLQAASGLEAIAERLPCLSDAPAPELLGRFHFLRGLVAYYADGAQAATDRFQEALLVSPFLQWDTSWPPPVRPAFDAAVQGALAAQSAFLSVSPAIVGDGGLRLDGLVLDPRTRTRTLYEGTHLVQWKDRAGATTSWLVEVDGGDTVGLAARADAVRELLTGQADALLSAHARGRVLAPVEAESGGRLFTAQPWDVVLFHEFDAASGGWRLADRTALERWRSGGRGLRAAGIGTLVGGAALAVLGGVLAGDGVATGQGILDDVTASRPGSKLEELLSREADYLAAEQQLQGGITIGIVGGALAIGGVPLLVHGDRRAQGAGFHKRKR